MNAEILCLAYKYTRLFPETNEWNDWNKSGIDYWHYPNLTGSGLERYFRYTNGTKQTPVTGQEELSFFDSLLFGFFTFAIGDIDVRSRGLQALQAIKNQ